MPSVTMKGNTMSTAQKTAKEGFQLSLSACMNVKTNLYFLTLFIYFLQQSPREIGRLVCNIMLETNMYNF